jgi:hypothetical protein
MSTVLDKRFIKSVNLLKGVRCFLAFLILPLLLAACSGDNSAAPQAPQGPALILFYTDN